MNPSKVPTHRVSCTICKRRTNLRPRRLFPTASSSDSSVPARTPNTHANGLAQANTAAVAFRIRWGYDVVEDRPVEDGVWKYELIEENSRPESTDSKKEDLMEEDPMEEEPKEN